MFSSKDLLFSRPTGYSINNSLRFRASATAYLNRTWGTPANDIAWTFSFWMKRGQLTTPMKIINSDQSSNINFGTIGLSVYGDDALDISSYGTTSWRYQLITTRQFRDLGAWYHICIIYDSANATSTDRIRLYVNGTRETSFSTASYPSASMASMLNVNRDVRIGAIGSLGGSYYDGYLAEVNFVDGQALTPSSFGKTDANGVWQPIKYSGTYGTNGFYLKFADNSGATATTIGKDSSGNGNNWTPNNISVTADTTYDSMIDSPTNAASGTQPVGNYCVISPIDENFTTSNAVVSDGNLKFALSSNPANQQACRGTQAGVTKFYFEVVTLSVGAGLAFGVKTTGAQLTSSGGLQAAAAWEIIGSNGNKWNGSSVAYGSAYTTNDIGMCAVDPVNGKIWFGKNGTWFASGDPVAGTNAAFTNVVSSIQPLFECGVSTDSIAANFGQRPFSYTPPSGYQALCTANLPTPTITNGAGYMAATTYTGTGATQTISNSVNNTSFQPDLVWIKSRSAATNNNLFDSVRGATNYLISNSTAATATNANSLTAFGSTGFTLGSDSSSIGVNVNAATYVGWQWKGSGTTVNNTSGSITSTVCVNTTSGFSIATYTSPASGTFTVGHGLGVAPSFIINRITNVVNNWYCYHVSLGNNTELVLNTTGAAQSAGGDWNSTTPTSTVFSMGSTWAGSYPMVSYCFAPITGFSAFGSYTGNGSTDGPFVYLGFRPRWLMIKRSSTASVTYGWQIYDTSRQPYNTASSDPNLWADTSAAEGTGNYTFDLLSNGFKLRSSGVNENSSGDTYIYAAFAENPFNYSRAR